MKMRAFDFLMDIDVVNTWLNSRALSSVRPVDLPSFGLMAYDEQQSLGCLFLRHCEGDLGMICSLEINPSLGLKVKDKVFEELLSRVREFACLRGLKRLIVLSEKKSIIRKLEKKGWHTSQYKIVGLAALEGV